MADYSIEEFFDRPGVPQDCRPWALANCQTMEEFWHKAPSDSLMWVAYFGRILDDHTLRLWALESAKRLWHMLNKTHKKTLVLVEDYLNGNCGDDKLSIAHQVAKEACEGAFSQYHFAGQAATRTATKVAEEAACASWEVCIALAGEAARKVPKEDFNKVYDAELAKQWQIEADWLRDLAEPNFTKGS